MKLFLFHTPKLKINWPKDVNLKVMIKKTNNNRVRKVYKDRTMKAVEEVSYKSWHAA